MSRQDVDACSSPKEVVDHLGSYFRGIGAHPFLRDPVVTGQCKYYLMDDSGPWISLYSCHLDGKGLKLTQ